jgi:hypothetical protein
MTYIKIGESLYLATINGKLMDSEWGKRDSKAITLVMDYATAMTLFVNELAWSIVYQPDSYADPETGEAITPDAEEYDNSEYCVAGHITDNRDGTVTVKMGKKTDGEMQAELMEVLNNE